MNRAHLDALCCRCGEEIAVEAEQVNGEWKLVWLEENGTLHVHQPGEGRKNE